MLNINIRRGEIYLVDLGVQKGSIQSGVRPVVVISNNMNNQYSPTINVLLMKGEKPTSLGVGWIA